MDTSLHAQSVLLTQFTTFYYEVIRLKQLVTADRSATPAAQPEGDRQEHLPATTTVWQQLFTILEQQAQAPGPGAWEYGTEVYKDAQYVMAALADETFLHLEWAGKAAWRANLLESRLFASHVAGERLFQKLERLLQRRAPVYADLATVYLMALALGFRGKFWGLDDHGQLDRYRRQLFTFITQRQPGLTDTTRRLFPEAYAYTLAEARRTLLPTPRRWLLAVAGLVLCLGFMAHGIWTSVTADLRGILMQILSSK
jgi:type VI secretion system protein ImpK